MRRILSIFMVMLLALRGLAGDAMAMDHPAGHDPAQAVAAFAATAATASMLSAAHEMHEDAPMEHAHHGQPAATGHGTEHAAHATGSVNSNSDNDSNSAMCSHEAGPASDCGQHEAHCSSCGLCHTAMGQPRLAALTSFLPTAAQPRHQAAHFASAAPAQVVKPPIPAV